jgi:hypothetical protein
VSYPVINSLEMKILFLIGYFLALHQLAVIAYRVKVLGFKSYFHKITEFVGIEKKLFLEINSFCFVLFSLFTPIILFSYPLLIEWWGSWIVPEDFETLIILLRIIALIIYIAAIVAGFSRLPFFLSIMWKSGKDKKRSN